jgi:hypothetical protein
MLSPAHMEFKMLGRATSLELNPVQVASAFVHKVQIIDSGSTRDGGIHGLPRLPSTGVGNREGTDEGASGTPQT